VIELQGLQKVIDHNLALDIAALNIEAGKTVALVGPMGNGKTHLLKLLIGRTRPTLGTLRLAGIDPRQDKDQFSRRAGVLCARQPLQAPDVARRRGSGAGGSGGPRQRQSRQTAARPGATALRSPS